MNQAELYLMEQANNSINVFDEVMSNALTKEHNEISELAATLSGKKELSVSIKSMNKKDRLFSKQPTIYQKEYLPAEIPQASNPYSNLVPTTGANELSKDVHRVGIDTALKNHKIRSDNLAKIQR